MEYCPASCSTYLSKCSWNMYPDCDVIQRERHQILIAKHTPRGINYYFLGKPRRERARFGDEISEIAPERLICMAFRILCNVHLIIYSVATNNYIYYDLRFCAKRQFILFKRLCVETLCKVHLTSSCFPGPEGLFADSERKMYRLS